MKVLTILIASAAAINCTPKKAANIETVSKTTPQISAAMTQKKSIYDFKVESLDGQTIDFANYKGRKILIVNTASECGFTPQYAELEKLYEQYREKLVIVGFPANNFGGQEPGSNEQIKSFCQKNYGVTFPMAAKVSVSEEEVAPIFQYLTQKSQNGVKDTKIKWNFTKFLLDENGRLINSFESSVKPFSPDIIKYL